MPYYYFIPQNFAVLVLAAAMLYICVENYRLRPFMSRVILSIIGITLLLSVFIVLEYYGIENGNVPVATVFCYLGYIIRPFLLYFFILLVTQHVGKFQKIILIPLFLNVLVYTPSLFMNYEPFGHLVFYYVMNPATGTLDHMRGPLNFTSHILSIIYLVGLIYFSLKLLRGKHRQDSISILICASMIVAAVVAEMTGFANNILNVTVMISVVFFYLFILKEENRRDSLTGLFDRKTFYLDVKKFQKDITGVIQIDMNGLKRINDTQGHEAGDKALSTIARIIVDHTKNTMYVYRVGGDEYTILVVKEKEEALRKVIDEIHAELEKNNMTCSIGYAYRIDKKASVDDLLKLADQYMYQDKAAFYQSHPEINRRRR